MTWEKEGLHCGLGKRRVALWPGKQKGCIVACDKEGLHCVLGIEKFGGGGGGEGLHYCDQ